MKKTPHLLFMITILIALVSNSLAGDLNGTWTGYEVDWPSGNWTFVFADSQLTVNGPNPGEYYKMNVIFLEDDKHKKVKARFYDASDPSVSGLSSTAIYKLEEGKLTIAAGEPGYGTVPKSFEKIWGVYVFNLTKKEEKKK